MLKADLTHETINSGATISAPRATSQPFTNWQREEMAILVSPGANYQTAPAATHPGHTGGKALR